MEVFLDPKLAGSCYPDVHPRPELVPILVVVVVDRNVGSTSFEGPKSR